MKLTKRNIRVALHRKRLADHIRNTRRDPDWILEDDLSCYPKAKIVGMHWNHRSHVATILRVLSEPGQRVHNDWNHEEQRIITYYERFPVFTRQGAETLYRSSMKLHMQDEYYSTENS